MADLLFLVTLETISDTVPLTYNDMAHKVAVLLKYEVLEEEVEYRLNEKH